MVFADGRGIPVVNLVWAPFLKRRSPLGRQTADEIAGFRQFLETVEHDPLNRIDSDDQLPRKTGSLLAVCDCAGGPDCMGRPLDADVFRDDCDG